MLETLPAIKLPIDPFAIARDNEIELAPVSNSKLDFSGCLRKEGKTWGIMYRDDIPSDGFKRFTVAHELGHFEMAEHHDVLFTGGNMHVSESGFTSHLWYEHEADHFAAELLAPEDLFQDAMRGVPIGATAIQQLADQFGTSFTCTAIRYAQLTPDPVVIVVSGDERIRYSFSSQCMKSIKADWIERATLVTAGTETAAHYRSKGAEGIARSGSCYLSAWFPNASRDFEVREEVVDLGQYGRVVTVLHATVVPDEEEYTEQQIEEDPDVDNFNRDGKRIRFS
jgi:hypothetical protein